MKLQTLTVLAFALCSLNSFAAGRTVVSCEGGNLEGAAIAEDNGRLEGSMAWDCFPGGGICNARAIVTEGRDASGNIVFEGPNFRLVVETNSRDAVGNYKSYLTAKDTVDGADEGRGFTYGEYVSCKEGQ